MATGTPLNTTGLTPNNKQRIADLESMPEGLAQQAKWRAPFYQQETDLTYQVAPEEIADMLRLGINRICGGPKAVQTLA